MATLTSPTLERLIKETRIMLNQPQKANSFWTDEELTVYLNDAVRVYFMEVNERAEGQFDTKVELDLVNGQEEIDLPADCFEVKTLAKKWTTANKILTYKVNLTDPTTALPQGGPNYYEPFYYFRGNKIVLNPIPGFDETAGLILEYTAFPEQMIYGGDAMSARVTPVFKELIVMYAVYKAKIKESLTTGSTTYGPAQTLLADLFTTFKNDIGGRSKYPQYTVPYKY